MVLAIVLGDKAEESFRQSLLASQGGLSVFWSTGLVSTIMALGLIALFWPLISKVIQLILGADKGGLKPAE
jgi:putative tricarboxylic transport membrane protein